MSSQREAFENKVQLDKGVYWCVSARCYMRDAGGGFTVSDRTANDKWEGWQAATENALGEPVGFMFEDDFERLSNTECCTDIYSVEAGHPDKGTTTVKLYAKTQE